MKLQKRYMTLASVLILLTKAIPVVVAQDGPVILTGAQLARVVPPGFYFEGLSAPTQMRNSAAARLGEKRYVVVGMVDTSGYSADVRAKYEGFFITDSSINVGDEELGPGAYGFGFTDNGKFNLFDVRGKQIESVNTTRDAALRRPRPLMMAKDGNKVRLYSGRNYVLIETR